MTVELTDIQQQILDALNALIAEQPRRARLGFTSNEIARKAGLAGARRLGNGAVKGSWTGRMSPAVRAAPTLRSLEHKQIVQNHYDTDNYRWLWTLR